MNRSTIVKGAAVAAALVAVSVGSATAASQITAHDLATGAANHRVIADGSVHQSDMTGQARTLLNRNLSGAIYRVENYQNGGGGSATVACADDEATSQKYTAIAGGVQGSESGKTETQSGFLVSSSFPGRMNWTDGVPKPGRLDGWIVFGNSQYTGTLKVWALCVPNTSIGVTQIDLDNKRPRR